MPRGTVVVYVHGLWLTGLESALLRKRLRRDLAADTQVFTYASVRSSVTANARALAEFSLKLPADTLHLVGHSLGGLVILKLFESGAGAHLPNGRIVLLGSPVNGSRAARHVAHLPFGKALLGRGIAEELLADRERHWRGERELGVIAGSLRVGLGRLVGMGGAPSDGTILIDETRIPGAAHLVLNVSHFGLPFSPLVARHTASFLRSGNFGL